MKKIKKMSKLSLVKSTVSMALLGVLFSASMGAADSFVVNSLNYGQDFDGTKTEVIVNTKTSTTPLNGIVPTGPDLNVDTNIIDTTAIGAHATLAVDVDIDMDLSSDKFYDDAQVRAENRGETDSFTETMSSVGSVTTNTINTASIGANAAGTYTNSKTVGQPSTEIFSVATFEVAARNTGVNIAGDTGLISARTATFTTYHPDPNAPAGTLAALSEGEDVSANIIDTQAIGSNASMSVEVDIECDCNGKFYTDVNVQSHNQGAILASTDTWSDVGSVLDNTISTTAIGASASGSYANLSTLVAP